MTPLDALLELLGRVGASRDGTVLVSEEELGRWPAAAVRQLKAQRLLVRARPADTVVCPGCEEECTMPVHTVTDGADTASSFIVCDKRDDTNRVSVSAERLRQWQCGVGAVGGFVAHSLGMRSKDPRKAEDGLRELGLMTGKRRSQMVCLRANGVLELVVGNNTVPLAEVVRHGAEGHFVDSEAVRQLVDTATADSRYTPNNARLQVRKEKTQTLYKRWRKEYRALKNRCPEMSDRRYSEQIAKMGIAREKSAETIRKHLKR